jgi:hypothetical protein
MPADRSSIPALPHTQGLGEDPLQYFTKVYLMFFQGLFAQFPPSHGCFYWSDDEHTSEIMITDQAPIPADRIEQRPALITMRGPAQFANLSMDQLRELDMKTGEREHTDLVSCTMTINCIAKNGLEAQRLAWIVARHIRTFKRLLQRQKMHRVGEQVSVGPETPPGSLVDPEPDTEMVNVVVHSPFFFQWTERVRPTNAEILQGIETHITANLPPVTAISSGAVRPTEGALEQHGDAVRIMGQGCVRSKIPTIRGRPLNGTSVPIDGSEPEPTGSLSVTVKV